MTSLVSYGKLRPAFVGILRVIFGDLIRRARNGESPVALKPVEDVIQFGDSGIWGTDSVDPSVEPRVFRVADFEGDFKLSLDSAPYRAIPESRLEKLALHDGDILVVKSSGSARQVVSGRVAVFTSRTDQTYTASNFLMRLRTNRNVDPIFLAFALGSPPVREEIADRIRTMTYPNLPFKLYRSILVPIVPLADQKCIAHFLVACLKQQPLPRLPRYLSEQRRVVMKIEQLAVRLDEASGLRDRAIRVSGNVLPAEACRSIGSAKPLVRLGDGLFDVIYRYPTFYNIQYRESGVGLLKIGNLTQGTWEIDFITRRAFIDQETSLRFPRTILDEGDLLMAARGATIGKTAYVSADYAGFNINANLLRLKPNPRRLDGKYFWHFMKSPLGQRQFALLVTSTAKETVTVPKLKTIVIPLPALAAQRRIVAHLDALQADLDRLRQLQAKSSAELDALLPSILDTASRGEL